MKERFSDEEWEQVLACLADAIDTVADADPEGEGTELVQVIQDLTIEQVSPTQDPLFREAAVDLLAMVKRGDKPASRPAPKLYKS
jgi:hypothetical protein